MERFMITLTPTSNEQINAYQINGSNCSFLNGTFTFVTSGEDVVNILGQPSYIMITPLDAPSSDDYNYSVMVTVDDSKPPTFIFYGKNNDSNLEVYMDHECKIVFKEDDNTDCLTPSDIDEIVDKPDVKAEEPKQDKKPLIQKPVEADVERSDANIAELTSYDRVMNAIYDIFSENSVIDMDREMFNDICTDGISIEARNWKVSMHPYLVTFQKELCPYTQVLHVSIEKTRKHHNGIRCGMYENRGTLSFLFRFNDKGNLTQIVSTSAAIDPNEYLNQEIRDLFTEIEKAKIESREKGFTLPLREDITPYTSDDDNIKIHC